MGYSKEQIQLAQRSVTSGGLTIDWDYVDNREIKKTIKDGRRALYFWNAGGFNRGSDSIMLGNLYADKISELDVKPDILFGPAYKGITLAQAAAMLSVANCGRDIGWLYDRKEVKDHGEKGDFVGCPIFDGARIHIVDDVISSAATKVAAVKMLNRYAQNEGVEIEFTGLTVILDREQKAVIDGTLNDTGRQIDQSAAQYFTELTGIHTTSILGSTDMFGILKDNPVPHRVGLDQRLFVDDNFITNFKEYQVEFGTKQF